MDLGSKGSQIPLQVPGVVLKSDAGTLVALMCRLGLISNVGKTDLQC